MSERRALTSVWLVPCQADAARFQQVIDALAERQSAPRFLPHVSLGSVQANVGGLDVLITLLRGLELAPLYVGSSPSFTMSLFVQLGLTPQLQKAREWLESQPKFKSIRRFDPHISLCYGAPPERDDLAPAIDALARKPVRFDRLVLVKVTVPVETHDDIARWTPLAEHFFA